MLWLLKLLSQAHGLATVQDMARTMGVGEALVREMMSQAVALGYLEVLPPGCGKTECRSCRERGSCPMAVSAQVWSLTQKGKRLVEERTESTAGQGQVRNEHMLSNIVLERRSMHQGGATCAETEEDEDEVGGWVPEEGDGLLAR